MRLAAPVRAPHVARMAESLSIAVEAAWDQEGRVWVATSDDVPGLVAHSTDFAALVEMAAELVPLLLIENGIAARGATLRDVRAHVAAHGLARSSARLAA